jgi:hypothetical protein
VHAGNGYLLDTFLQSATNKVRLSLTHHSIHYSGMIIVYTIAFSDCPTLFAYCGRGRTSLAGVWRTATVSWTMYCKPSRPCTRRIGSAYASLPRVGVMFVKAWGRGIV